jgi:hypothetical protein
VNQTLRSGIVTLPLTATLLLAACTNPPFQPAVHAPVAPPAATQLKAANLVNNLNQLTDDDLSKAISLATTMKDTQAVTCFQFIQKELPILRSGVAVVTAQGGLFTTFEAGHVVVGWAENGLPDKAAFETACGPYVLSIVGGLNFILEQIKVNPVPLPKL